MVLDPIPQSLPVHFFWVSTPAPHLSNRVCARSRATASDCKCGSKRQCARATARARVEMRNESSSESESENEGKGKIGARLGARLRAKVKAKSKSKNENKIESKSRDRQTGSKNDSLFCKRAL